MSAIEEIQAAIEKLTASKRELTACPEFNRQAMRHIARNCDIECDCDNSYTICGWDRHETASAFDMLIRTVDAQLAILGDFMDRYEGRAKGSWVPIAPAAVNILTLARAINGANS